jgi:hypothetical protein
VLARAVFLSEVQGLLSSSLVAGRIQFLIAVKLRSLLYGWLSARYYSSY